MALASAPSVEAKNSTADGADAGTSPGFITANDTAAGLPGGGEGRRRQGAADELNEWGATRSGETVIDVLLAGLRSRVAPVATVATR